MFTRALFPALVLFASVVGCDDLPYDPGGENADGNGGCVEEVTVLAGVDAATSLGFTAASVLAVAEGSHATEMAWDKGLDDGPVKVAFGPESGAGELTVGVAYQGGEVRFIHSTPEETEYEGGFAECHDRLEVDVAVTVKTAGGALDEQFVAPLRATSRGIGRISHELAVDELAGSFALTTVEPEDAEVGPIALNLGVSESGLFGDATTTVQLSEDGAVGVGFMNVAHWPPAAGACEFGEAAVGLAAAVAQFSGADALAVIDAAPVLSLTWQGEAATEMVLDVTPGSVVCAYDAGESAGTLRIPAEAAVETADGRWHGSFAVEVIATPAADGSLAGVRVQIYAPYAVTVAADQFLATYGLDGVDLSAYEFGGLDFSGEFVPADGGATATGQVTVLGVNNPPCSNEPGAPCMGSEITEVAMATWKTP